MGVARKDKHNWRRRRRRRRRVWGLRVKIEETGGGKIEGSGGGKCGNEDEKKIYSKGKLRKIGKKANGGH